ncbi:MAG TPA: hybrid sensor histidine kinase/response regulator, partial [Myxococcales bacterium]|nr:hybrid sensor histidine kinase/response regulator [Myxococcales bacterium]
MTRMGRVRVLLVDDDPLLLRTGERLLRRFLGAEVVTSSNGREALDRIERGERFHLVITDLEMPEMDGF